MAIKTTGTGSALRIITKTVDGEVRVSCECCEPCCMYPAQALTDGLYTAADLPDEIVMYYGDGTNFEGPTIVSKVGSQYTGDDQGVQLSPQGDEWIMSYFQLDPSASCLIDGLEEELSSFGDTYVLVFDNFEDTYTGTYENNSTVTFTRESLCVWRGNDLANTVLSYVAAETYAGWFLNGISKTSGIGTGQLQNTPTGLYDLGGQGDEIVVS